MKITAYYIWRKLQAKKYQFSFCSNSIYGWPFNLYNQSYIHYVLGHILSTLIIQN